jgi:hypothetical protein
LLEVLIAMFVLAVGLLYVAAVIPVARFEIVEAAKADRSAATGHAMLSHVEAASTSYAWDPLATRPSGAPAGTGNWVLTRYRPMLDPYTWLPAFEGNLAQRRGTWPQNIFRFWILPTSTLRPTHRDPLPLPFVSRVLAQTQPPSLAPELANCLRNRPLAIDPLYLAGNPEDLRGGADADALRRISSFPYWPTDYDPAGRNPAQRGFMHELTLRRVTWQQGVAPIPVGVQSPLAAFETIMRQFEVSGRNCTWRDDLKIPVPQDRDDRPRQMMVSTSTATGTATTLSAAYPFRPADFAANALPAGLGPPLVAETAGKYSWLVTVTPAKGPWMSFNPNGSPFPDGDEYPVYSVEDCSECRLSVVVFYERDFASPRSDGASPPMPADPRYNRDKPAERTVFATFLGSGHGGGDVRLVAPAGPAGNPTQYESYLEVKEGEWLLLGGTKMHSLGNPRSGQAPVVREFVFRWYRIVAVGELEVDAGRASRIVTLEGPDWTVTDLDPNTHDPGRGWCLRYDPATGGWNPANLPARYTDMNGDRDPHDVVACLFDGVIGVYTKTVQFD